MFSTTDPYGREIKLTKETWYDHICVRHPELKPLLKEIQETIENPSIIAKSSSKPDDTQIYFDRPLSNYKYKNLYLKVVVDLNEDNTGAVATSLLQKDFQGATVPGGMIYVKKK